MKTRKFLAMTIATVLLGAAAGARADAQRESLEELRHTVINLLQALVDQGVSRPVAAVYSAFVERGRSA